MTWVVGGVCVIVGLYGLHRLALRLERDGWIRYANGPAPDPVGYADLLGELQRIYEPKTKVVHEIKHEARPRRDDETGEPNQASRAPE